MENSMEMYGFIEWVKQSYQLLQDDLSRKIFEARLAFEYDPSPANAARLVDLSEQRKWMDVLDEQIPAIACAMKRHPRKLVLYGTNVTGRAIASRLFERGVEFYGFCGCRAKKFPNGLMGKPVLLPEYLSQHPDAFYVVISASECADALVNILKENRFPQEQILFNFKPTEVVGHQYFEFPSLFHRERHLWMAAV